MIFTREDILKILNALLQLGRKDSEFKDANTPLNSSDEIAILQDGINKKVSINNLLSTLGLLKKDDFINVSDRYDEYYILLSEAITIIANNKRKKGLVITFLDLQGDWKIFQFDGELNNFSNTDYWKDLFDFKYPIVNSVLPDEEDLTLTLPNEDNNSFIKLKDKEYDITNFSGMGTKIIRKNIIEITLGDGTIKRINYLSSDVFNSENTIYVIQYDFTLTEDIIIPSNCVLKFDGGSLSGAYTITGTNTEINAGLIKIFNTNVILDGTWKVNPWFTEWFGAKGDGETDDSSIINTVISIIPEKSTIELPNDYKVASKILINKTICLIARNSIISTYGAGPTIEINATNHVELYIEHLLDQYSGGLNYTETDNYNYNVGIALKNCFYTKATINHINGFSTGVFLLSESDCDYNIFNFKLVLGCFNPIKITSKNRGAVNGNYFNNLNWQYRSWSMTQMGDYRPYMIVSNSIDSGNNPYYNNSNIFRNLVIEYSADYEGNIGHQQPKVIKADYCSGYQLDIRRIEVSRYQDEPEYKFVTLSNTQYMFIYVEFAWGDLYVPSKSSNICTLVRRQGNTQDTTNIIEPDITFGPNCTKKFGKVYADILNRHCIINVSISNSGAISSGATVLSNLPAPRGTDDSSKIRVGYAHFCNDYNYWSSPTSEGVIPFRITASGNLIIDADISDHKCTTYNISYYF